MDFLLEAIREPEGDPIDSAKCSSITQPVTDTITLDITYDDPELRGLFSVASSKWANENLTDSLKQGRVTNDLWALGLPTPDAVTRVSITDNQYLCVKVVVTCDELVVKTPSVCLFLTRLTNRRVNRTCHRFWILQTSTASNLECAN